MADSSLSVTSHPSSVNPTIINTSTHFITIKLTIENYLLWNAQIVPFLKGHCLFGYINGSIPKSSPTLNNIPNPEHSNWLLQDQLIISTINASLSENVLAQVLNCTSSRDVWVTLETLFLAQSSAHIMQTQFQIATMKKGSDSIKEYFHKATSLASALGAARQPLSSSEFIIYLLAGLGSDYESIVMSITTRPEPLTTPQVFSYLLNHEAHLQHQNNTLLSGTQLAANSASRQSPQGAAQGVPTLIIVVDVVVVLLGVPTLSSPFRCNTGLCVRSVKSLVT
ncbi:hypothetical protein F2P56_019707 [Juglans regia]|uniref:Retrotransposon Copia-like N-terminal domain-containing protein n=1 Tax=Juglans regia TaxID=51240 RepID=A0A833X4E7_JUGRE|nr:hypothetical protein F2P56_019707 [Juglans regia]